MNMAKIEAAAGDPDCSAGAPTRDLVERLRDSSGSHINGLYDREAADEIERLRSELARFTPLRAKGVVDADDNLDCWDTNPYEICTRHVAALNEKDPAAMWRVVDLFARDEG